MARLVPGWSRVPGEGAVGRVAAANFLIGAAVALVAASLGVLIPDALAQLGLAKVSPLRWTLLAALVLAVLAGLYAVTLLRASIHRRTGTLFYVRVQDDERSDWHAEPLEVARRQHMSLRSVTRWVDHTACTNPDGVIDLSATCAQVSAALEVVVNTDRDDTAYTIAPNMPWPVGLAVGAQLPLVDGLRLLELRGSRPDPATAATPPPPEVHLLLPDQDARPPARGWWRRVLAHEEGTLAHTGPAPGRVGLLLAFTAAGRDPNMTPEVAFAGTGVSTFHRLSIAAAEAADPARWQLSSADLAEVAPALIAAVVEVKNDTAGQRELVVAAALPKILSVVLGWGIAQSECRFFSGTHLLHYGRPAPRPLLPMRVHPAQPLTAPTT